MRERVEVGEIEDEKGEIKKQEGFLPTILTNCRINKNNIFVSSRLANNVNGLLLNLKS